MKRGSILAVVIVVGTFSVWGTGAEEPPSSRLRSINYGTYKSVAREPGSAGLKGEGLAPATLVVIYFCFVYVKATPTKIYEDVWVYGCIEVIQLVRRLLRWLLDAWRTTSKRNNRTSAAGDKSRYVRNFYFCVLYGS